MNVCVLIKELRCDLTHTAAKHYALVSSAQNAALSLSLSLASQTHTNRQAQIKRDIHVHTHKHTHTCLSPSVSSQDGLRRGLLLQGLFVSVCVTLSLGCVCGTCCRLVRYVNGKRDVGNAFIQTPKNTHTHVHILKNMCSGVQKPHSKFWDSTFKTWK